MPTTLLVVLDGWGHSEGAAAQRDSRGAYAQLGPLVAHRAPHPALRFGHRCRPAGRPDGQLRSRTHASRRRPGHSAGTLPPLACHRRRQLSEQSDASGSGRKGPQRDSPRDGAGVARWRAQSRRPHRRHDRTGRRRRRHGPSACLPGRPRHTAEERGRQPRAVRWPHRVNLRPLLRHGQGRPLGPYGSGIQHADPGRGRLPLRRRRRGARSGLRPRRERRVRKTHAGLSPRSGASIDRGRRCRRVHELPCRSRPARSRAPSWTPTSVVFHVPNNRIWPISSC